MAGESARMPWLGHRAVGSPAFRRMVAQLALDPLVALLALGVATVAIVLSPWRRVARRWVEACASTERARTARLGGRVIPGGSTGLGRPLGYLLALPLLATVSTVAVVVALSVPLTLVLLPLYLPAMPGGAVRLPGVSIGSEGGALVVAAASAAFLVLAAPTVLRAASMLQVGTAAMLLGSYATVPDAALTRRVEELVVSRARVVDSIEAERRRIERDLHDGAQQRLVALALLIGRAQARLDPEDDPADPADPAGPPPSPLDRRVLQTLTRLLAEAHAEADAAIAELRDLARGLVPPVLDEHGLDAALTDLASRSVLRVEVDIAAGERPPRSVEAALYFVAAEALTNAAKHAAAERVVIELRRVPGHVRLVVTDDGRGGARVDGGGGLVGLADRLAGVDGTLRVHSPAGGPTTLTAEV